MFGFRPPNLSTFTFPTFHSPLRPMSELIGWLRCYVIQNVRRTRTNYRDTVTRHSAGRFFLSDTATETSRVNSSSSGRQQTSITSCQAVLYDYVPHYMPRNRLHQHRYCDKKAVTSTSNNDAAGRRSSVRCRIFSETESIRKQNTAAI